MEDVLVPVIVVPTLFIGSALADLPLYHQVEAAATLTRHDEKMLDELYDTRPPPRRPDGNHRTDHRSR